MLGSFSYTLYTWIQDLYSNKLFTNKLKVQYHDGIYKVKQFKGNVKLLQYNYRIFVEVVI
jgi:hypothetical protein